MMDYKTISLPAFGLLLECENKNFNVNHLDINDLRQLVKREHLIILRGFNTFSNTNAFEMFCERFGEISIWPFGKVLELIEQEKPDDHIFDHGYVPLHWDGMYRSHIPELQIFHCLKAPLKDQGGRTFFSNTITALENASLIEKKLWQKVTGIYERKMEFYHSKVFSKIITRHPFEKFSVIRYNEPHNQTQKKFINPPILQFKGLYADELNEFHFTLKQSLYAQNNFYAHAWYDNDIVIADNFSLLHGREAFITKSPRHLQRVHILSQPNYVNENLEFYQ